MSKAFEDVLLQLISEYGGLAWVDLIPAQVNRVSVDVMTALESLAAHGEVVFDGTDDTGACVWRRNAVRSYECRTRRTSIGCSQS